MSMPRVLYHVLTAACALVCPTLQAQTVTVGQPTMRIGGDADADGRLANVVGAVRLPNGQIVVGNRRGDHALLVYNRSGKFLRALGRSGKGPGEIGYLLRLMRCGDALYTSDIEGERVQEFTLDLVYKRAFRFGTNPYKTVCNERGQFLHMGWEPARAMRIGLYRADTPFWITPADSSAGILLGKLPGSERFGVGRDGKVGGSSPTLFGREPALAFSAQRAYVTLGDSVHVLVFDLAGKAAPGIVGSYKPVAPTAADVELEIEREVALNGEQIRPHLRDLYKQIPLPRAFPATRDLHVDPAGVLWVQSYPTARRKTVAWRLFRETGASLGAVELPAAFEIYEIGRDYVLGGLLDPDTGATVVELRPVSRR